MKVLQIVTYISPDGAYGGPVRVAINQAKALSTLGHDVVVAAAAGGFKGPLPGTFDGFPVRLFPARRIVPKSGFAGITSPRLLIWLAQRIRSVDVVHIHLARDLVTLPSAVIVLAAGKPLVVQTHGMIDQTEKALASPLDCAFTRPVLRTAQTVLYLTNREKCDLAEVAGENLSLTNLPNGVILSQDNDELPSTSKNTAVEVLYLARLHRRKRPLIFVEAAIHLLSDGILGSFKIVGPDEGEGSRIKRTIADSSFAENITYEGALGPHETSARLHKCDIYVLPSVDEPFPMSAIEAMAAGKPIIITNTCGLSSQVKEAEAGIVVDDSAAALMDAMKCLITNEALRLRMGRAARKLAENEYNVIRVGERLENVYEDATQKRKNKTN